MFRCSFLLLLLYIRHISIHANFGKLDQNWFPQWYISSSPFLPLRFFFSFLHFAFSCSCSYSSSRCRDDDDSIRNLSDGRTFVRINSSVDDDSPRTSAKWSCREREREKTSRDKQIENEKRPNNGEMRKNNKNFVRATNTGSEASRFSCTWLWWWALSFVDNHRHSFSSSPSIKGQRKEREENLVPTLSPDE